MDVTYLITLIMLLITYRISVHKCNIYIVHPITTSKNYNEQESSDDCNRTISNNNRQTDFKSYKYENDSLPLHTTIKSLYNGPSDVNLHLTTEKIPEHLPKQFEYNPDADQMESYEKFQPKLPSDYVKIDHSQKMRPTVSEPLKGNQFLLNRSNSSKKPFERLELEPSMPRYEKRTFDFEDKAYYNTLGKSAKYRSTQTDDINTESPVPLGEPSKDKETYIKNEHVEPIIPEEPQTPLRTKKIRIAQPALKAKTFEVYLPAIQKEFYDIEERFIIKPAGAIVVELDKPIKKIPKGETILALGHPHPAVADAYHNNGKSNAFSNIIYSSADGFNKPQESDGHLQEHLLPSEKNKYENHEEIHSADHEGKKDNIDIFGAAATGTKENLKVLPYENPLKENHSKDFEVEYFDETSATKTYLDHNNSKQYGPNRQQVMTDGRNIFNKNISLSTAGGQYYLPNSHNEQRKTDDNTRIPTYSTPYANIKYYKNYYDETPSKNVTLLDSFSDTSTKQENENGHKMRAPHRNIIIYANNNVSRNQPTDEIGGKAEISSKRYQTPLRYLIVYSNLNKTNEDENDHGLEDISSKQEDEVDNSQRDRYQQFGNEQKFLRLIEKPKNNRKLQKSANYASQKESIDLSPTSHTSSHIDLLPGSRVIASTPASKDPSLINESVQTRRVVINHPFHTVREIVEHEPYTNYHEVVIEEPDFPEIFKTAHYGHSNKKQ